VLWGEKQVLQRNAHKEGMMFRGCNELADQASSEDVRECREENIQEKNTLPRQKRLILNTLSVEGILRPQHILTPGGASMFSPCGTSPQSPN
jgi:hypothetical protein